MQALNQLIFAMAALRMLAKTVFNSLTSTSPLTNLNSGGILP